MSRRLIQSRAELIAAGVNSPALEGLLAALVYYHRCLDQLLDLVERRILRAEQIPHEDKIFSIFEPHVEWIQKGKWHKKVELGHKSMFGGQTLG